MHHVSQYLDLLLNYHTEPSVIIDATLGNGNDSLKLAQLFPRASIFSFDIQMDAIIRSKELFDLHQVENITTFLDSHENIDKHVVSLIDLVVFNLGYLPRGDKSIHTNAKSTIRAIKNIMPSIKKKGSIFITAYPGSIKGNIEMIELNAFLEDVDQKSWNISKIEFINQVNQPPVLYNIQKK